MLVLIAMAALSGLSGLSGISGTTAGAPPGTVILYQVDGKPLHDVAGNFVYLV